MNELAIHTFMSGLLVGYTVGIESGSQAPDFSTLNTPEAGIKEALESINAVDAKSNYLLVTCLQAIKYVSKGHVPQNMTTELCALMTLVEIAQQNEILPEAYMQHVWATCASRNQYFDMTLRKIGHVLGWGSPVHAMRHIAPGQYPVYEAITIAIYCLARSQGDFVIALNLAKSAPHTVIIICTIVGALCTLQNGITTIPIAWRQRLDEQINLSDFTHFLS